VFRYGAIDVVTVEHLHHNSRSTTATLQTPVTAATAARDQRTIPMAAIATRDYIAAKPRYLDSAMPALGSRALANGVEMMFRHGVVLFTSLAVGSGCVASGDKLDDGDAIDQIATVRQSLSFPDRVDLCNQDPRVIAELITIETCIGGDLFFRETFDGNGRSCATCHRVDDNLAIDPALIATLPATDPLFIAETNPALAGLEIPAQMRRFGLILENLDGTAPDPRVRFVLRSVPHTLSIATSVTRASDDPVTTPQQRTGWSGDGAPGAGTLRDFQTGAIIQHYTKNLGRVEDRDFRLATQPELNRIDTFLRSIGRSNELALASVAMSDAGAEAGRARFLTVGCNGCHANAGANAGFGTGGNRNFNTGVETARHADLAAFPIDGGFLAAPANPNGSFGDGTFNAPPLIEAADTGPFFHTATTISGASAHNTDVATTIEEAIAFYDSPAFNNSPSGKLVPIDLTATEIDNIGRFLRGINAAFNIALAVKRLDGTSGLITRFLNGKLTHQRELLRLANVEVADAIKVLSAVPSLNASSLSLLSSARDQITTAQTTATQSARVSAIAAARAALTQASSQIGTSLSYTIGEGTLMF
jgi:mono/diheme cytochrome c family protein